MATQVLVKKYFDTCYDGNVERVQFVKHVNDLDRLVANREETVMNLERSILADMKKTPTAGAGVVAAEASKATQKLQERLHEENKNVAELLTAHAEQTARHERRATMLANTTLGSIISIFTEDTLKALSENSDESSGDEGGEPPPKEKRPKTSRGERPLGTNSGLTPGQGLTHFMTTALALLGPCQKSHHRTCRQSLK